MTEPTKTNYPEGFEEEFKDFLKAVRKLEKAKEAMLKAEDDLNKIRTVLRSIENEEDEFDGIDCLFEKLKELKLLKYEAYIHKNTCCRCRF